MRETRVAGHAKRLTTTPRRSIAACPATRRRRWSRRPRWRLNSASGGCSSRTSPPGSTCARSSTSARRGPGSARWRRGPGTRGRRPRRAASCRALAARRRSRRACRRAAAAADALTLITATDGNHGRAVARTARLLGLPARVYVPEGVPDVVIDRINAEGALLTVVDADYDGAVMAARADAEARWLRGPRRRSAVGGVRAGGMLIQDTAWDGYEQVPSWIVAGYETLFAEIDAQLAAAGAAAFGGARAGTDERAGRGGQPRPGRGGALPEVGPAAPDGRCCCRSSRTRPRACCAAWPTARSPRCRRRPR